MDSSIEFTAEPKVFYLKNSRTGEVSDKTVFKASFDGENFLFRFECKEDYFYPKYTEYNDPLYEGDIVELMITLGEKNYYLETETNFNGADYCVKIRNRDSKGDIEIEKIDENFIKSCVKTVKNGWVCDIIISERNLKKLGFKEKFFINAHRQDFDESGKLNLYSLSPALSETFHVTDAFLSAEIRR